MWYAPGSNLNLLSLERTEVQVRLFLYISKEAESIPLTSYLQGFKKCIIGALEIILEEYTSLSTRENHLNSSSFTLHGVMATLGWISKPGGQLLRTLLLSVSDFLTKN